MKLQKRVPYFPLWRGVGWKAILCGGRPEADTSKKVYSNNLPFYIEKFFIFNFNWPKKKLETKS